MRRGASLALSLAALTAITSVDLIGFISAAEARSRSAPSRSFTPSSKPSFRPSVRPHVTPRVMHRTFVKPVTPHTLNKNVFRYVPKYVAKGSAVSPLAQQIQVRRGLPFLKPAVGAGPLKARLAAPINAQPKLTLVKAPKPALTPRFGPFVQRHWKKAFFWVAVAGIGYLTVPEYYYDRFLGYVDAEDPDYDSALGLLALAAVDDDEDIVRMPRPASVSYRYTVSAAPPKEMISQPTTIDPAKPINDTETTSCTLKPFVDRKWSQAYVWVQVPEVGDVTVPEEAYDKFVGYVGNEPPNYPSACAVLAEAAAADTISPAVSGAPS